MNLFLRKFSFTKLDFLVIIIIVALGIINLPTPLGGDQALFLTGAKEIAKGKILYKDFWDMKPPGIYYFYYLGGLVFGFSEIGIHIFELLFWVLLSFILIKAFRFSNTFENKSIVSLSPLFTVGIYYSFSYSFTLTQVEGLVNVFLFLTLFMALMALKSTKKKFFFMSISGLIGFVVLTFKLMFLPIIGSFWLSIFFILIFRQKEKFRIIIRQFLIPLILGIFIPAIILFIYYVKLNLLNITYWTFFVYPPRALNEIPLGDFAKLYELFLFYVNNFYPILALAIFGIFISVLHKKDLLSINLFLWLIWAIIIIILTRVSWWKYHLYLLNIPVGIFSLVTIDLIWSSIKKHDLINSWKGKTILLITMLLFFLPALHSNLKKVKFFSKYISTKTNEKRMELYARYDNKYKYVIKNINILMKRNSLDGNIWVAGSPLFYYVSGRDQAIATPGWILEELLHEQWDGLIMQLKKNRPSYIFIDDAYEKFIPNVSPETVWFIKKNYTVLSNTKDGIWYGNTTKLKDLINNQQKPN